MKKILLFICLLSTLAVSAQEYELTGKVVDKKTGTPIAGATVTSMGAYTTETDYDGSFKLSSMVPLKSVKVTAPGMNYETKKATQGMTVGMKSQTFWNKKPEKWSPFVSLEFGIPRFNELSLGFMAGYVKTHGFYVKALFSPSKEYGGYERDPRNKLTGNYSYSLSTYGAGYICRVISPLYLYAGAGYMYSGGLLFETTEERNVRPSINDNSGEFEAIIDNSPEFGAISFEAGVMGVYKKITVNVGCSVDVIGCFGYRDPLPHFHVGAGYMF